MHWTVMYKYNPLRLGLETAPRSVCRRSINPGSREQHELTHQVEGRPFVRILSAWYAIARTVGLAPCNCITIFDTSTQLSGVPASWFNAQHVKLR